MRFGNFFFILVFFFCFGRLFAVAVRTGEFRVPYGTP
jgi:hypothetical protein